MKKFTAPRGTTAGDLYKKYESKRDPFLDRAIECSELTLPTLIPPKEHNDYTQYPTPYQGLGARGTKYLASKLLLALLPPNEPFFKYGLDDFLLEQLTEREDVRAEVEKALNKVERAVVNEVETKAIRTSAFEGFKHLLVGGNVLLHLPFEGGMRVFPLSQYVTKRTPNGQVLLVILKEKVSPLTISQEIKDACGVGETTNDEKLLDLYTYIGRTTDNTWTVYQELNGREIPNSRTEDIPPDACPWIPLRYTKIDGEDYGRGFVEEMLGDLRSYEALTMAMVQGAAAAAKLLFMVHPGGTTEVKAVQDADNGAVIEGNAADVTVLQMDKYADFRFARELAGVIEQRLAHSFLLNTSIQRDAERVTAQEIRYMAQELEDALGGLYSLLGEEFQLPLVKRLLAIKTRRGELPQLPPEVQPTITTGLEALGRNHELEKLSMFLNQLVQFAQVLPEGVAPWLNVSKVIDRLATGYNLDLSGMIRPEEEVRESLQQQQQQATLQDMIQKLGPEVLKQVGGAAAGQQ